MDHGDPGFQTFLELRKPVTVFVDGVLVRNVVTADEEQGIAVALIKTIPPSDEFGFARAVYLGSVEIREADAKA